MLFCHKPKMAKLLVLYSVYLNRGFILVVSVAIGHIAKPIILGQRHGGVGWPDPFFAVSMFPVIDRYPLRLGEPRSGHWAAGCEDLTEQANW